MDINFNYAIGRALPARKVGVISDKPRDSKRHNKQEKDEKSGHTDDDDLLNEKDRVKGVKIDKYV